MPENLKLENLYSEAKAVMQKENVRQEKTGVYFYDLCIEDSKIWFSDYDTGIVFEYDCAGEGRVNYRRDMYFGSYDKRLYTGIFKNTEWLILADGYKNLITFINITQMKCTKVNTESLTKGCVSFQNGDVFCQGNKIFIFAEVGMVLKYNVKSDVIEGIEYPLGLTKRGQVAKQDERILIPCLDRNYIYQFDLKTETFSQITLAEKVEGIETLCIVEDNYWITNHTDRIICWDRKKDQYDFFYYPYDTNDTIYTRNLEQMRAGKKFSKNFYLNGFIWMVPEYSPYIVYVDINCGKAQIFEIEGEEEDEKTLFREGRKNWAKYIASCTDADKVYLLSSKTEKVYEINTRIQTVKEVKIRISDVKKVIEMTHYKYVPQQQDVEDGRKYLL